MATKKLSTAQKKAMIHTNKLWAGAKARKNLKWPAKVVVVMKEFKKWTLHSWSGNIVKNPKQAIAIALSEAKIVKKKLKKPKK